MCVFGHRSRTHLGRGDGSRAHYGLFMPCQLQRYLPSDISPPCKAAERQLIEIIRAPSFEQGRRKSRCIMHAKLWRSLPRLHNGLVNAVYVMLVFNSLQEQTDNIRFSKISSRSKDKNYLLMQFLFYGTAV